MQSQGASESPKGDPVFRQVSSTVAKQLGNFSRLISRADRDTIIQTISLSLREGGLRDLKDLKIETDHGKILVSTSNGLVLFRANQLGLTKKTLTNQAGGLGGYYEPFEILASQCSSALGSDNPTRPLQAAVTAAWCFGEAFPDNEVNSKLMDDHQAGLYTSRFCRSPARKETTGRNFLLFSLLAFSVREALCKGQDPERGMLALAAVLRTVRQDLSLGSFIMTSVSVPSVDDSINPRKKTSFTFPLLLKEIKRRVSEALPPDETGLADIDFNSRNDGEDSPEFATSGSGESSSFDEMTSRLNALVLENFAKSSIPIIYLAQVVDELVALEMTEAAFRFEMSRTPMVKGILPYHEALSPLIETSLAITHDDQSDFKSEDRVRRALKDFVSQVLDRRKSCFMKPRERFFTLARTGELLRDVTKTVRKGMLTLFATESVEDIREHEIAVGKGTEFLEHLGFIKDSLTSSVYQSQRQLTEYPKAEIQERFINLLDTASALGKLFSSIPQEYLSTIARDMGRFTTRELVTVLGPSLDEMRRGITLSFADRVLLLKSEELHLTSYKLPIEVERGMFLDSPLGHFLSASEIRIPMKELNHSSMGLLSRYLVYRDFIMYLPKEFRTPTLADLVAGLSETECCKVASSAERYLWECQNLLCLYSPTVIAERCLLDGNSTTAAALVGSSFYPTLRSERIPGFPTPDKKPVTFESTVPALVMSLIERVDSMDGIRQLEESMTQTWIKLSHLHKRVEELNQRMSTYLLGIQRRKEILIPPK